MLFTLNIHKKKCIIVFFFVVFHLWVPGLGLGLGVAVAVPVQPAPRPRYAYSLSLTLDCMLQNIH